MKAEKIIIYTDGAAKGNPGKAGWGAIILSGKNIFEMGGRVEHATNNQMELTAPIEALKTAPILAVAPTGEPVELAQVVEAPPAETDAAPVTMAAAALPKTASSLPLIGLVGLLGLAGSFVLSIRSKRTA